MAQKFIIGVDVGGTNTDAVLISSSTQEIISSTKTHTTKDIFTGVSNAFSSVLSGSVKSEDIAAVIVGTTTFLNAVLENSEELSRVHVIRLCGTSSLEYPPFTDFPMNLCERIKGLTFLINGGFEYDKEEISQVKETELQEIADKLIALGSKDIINIVISGVFSILDENQELFCARFLSEKLKAAGKSFSITNSSAFGTLGLLEREAASILNASLKPLALKTITSFERFLEKHNICKKRLFLTKNDGTITSLSFAKSYPIYTFNSGPTNSLRGAFLLTKVPNAIVIDIGGTSSDFTVLKDGYPRPSSAYIRIAGVRTNFRMPDTLSLALGGGSIVKKDEKEEIIIGPESVGFNLKKFSKIFGGNTLTTTDIAVGAGLFDLGEVKDKEKLGINEVFVKKVFDLIKKKIEIAVDQMKTSQEPIPLILVGGGSILIPKDFCLEGVSEILKPNHFDVANALGAANAQISASHETVVFLENENRENALKKLKQNLTEKLVLQGAKESTIQFSFEEIPLSYIPGKATRISMEAIADLDFSKLEKVEFEETNDQFFHLDSGYTVDDVKKQEDIYIKTIASKNYFCPSEIQKNFEINNGKQEWILNEIDVDFICCGAGILGTGGGGSPYLGNLLLKKALKDGRKLRVIPLENLQIDECISWVAFYGAPLVQIEKLPGETSGKYSAEEMQKYLKGTKNCNIDAFVAVEIGGLNSIIPLLIASGLGKPVLDGDFMGRAFPELQMCTPFIYEVKKPFPLCMSDDAHNTILLTNIKENSPKRAENLLRHLVMKLGCFSALASGGFTKEELKKTMIPMSLTRAWEIGKAVFEARALKQNFVENFSKNKLGSKIFEGKIVDVSRSIDKGYTVGTVKIAGINEFTKKTLLINFQNENLIAKEFDQEADPDKFVIKEMVPNLITLLDLENYEAIMSEEYKYGLRVICITIPADPLLLTEKALKSCGPRAFGY